MFESTNCHFKKINKNFDKDCAIPLCFIIALYRRQLIIIGSILTVLLILCFKIVLYQSDEPIELSFSLDNNDKIHDRAEFPIKNNVNKMIFHSKLSQNDSELLHFTKTMFLVPPSTEEYNLRYRWGDPAFREKQNKYVLKILKGMKNGFFIESGANDGETLSSTLILERDYGWTGLLVEPDPYAYSELLKKNRKAWSSPACLSPEPYPQEVTFLHSFYSSTRSGIKSLVRIPTGKAEKVNATCLPIFTLLSALNVKTIDYFCLDVEGVELKVLKTIPFDSVFIKIFSIEYEHVPEGPRALRSFMTSKGYLLVKKLVEGNARDYLFVHESLKDNLPRPKLLKETNNS